MPLDKSAKTDRSGWASPDAFSEPFEKKATDMQPVADRGDNNSAMFAQNEQVASPFKHVEPVMIEPEERPRPTYEGVRRLLSGKPKQEVAAAPAPAPAPKRPHVNIAAINRLQPRAAVEQSTAAEREAQKAMLGEPAPQPANAPPPAPESISDPARETADQKTFQENLRKLVSFSRKPRTRGEVEVFKAFRRNAYSELFGLTRTAAPGFRELVRAWFQRFELPLKDGDEIGSKTLDRATEAARSFLQALSGPPATQTKVPPVSNRQIQAMETK